MKRVLILGGTRYFGKRLSRRLAEQGYKVSVLSRGNVDDGLGHLVERLRADRTNSDELRTALQGRDFDLVYDQVCYNGAQATLASELFAGRVGLYVHTSTVSVYDARANKPESDFDPASFVYDPAEEVRCYQHGKRQAEAVFLKAPFPSVFIRLPFVLGEDDPTGRLAFHVRRIAKGEGIYFPNLDAQVSMIHADDAARALHRAERLTHRGPLNVASAEPLRLRHLVGLIEAGARAKAVIEPAASGDNHSPYGESQDNFIDVSLAESLGLGCRRIKDWLPELVQLELMRLRA
jgi:nucleoside-diphosphate-sugar epimerase